MTARPESSATSPDCRTVVDEFARRFPEHDLDTLRLLMQLLQQRLGTAHEQPCDVERAQALGHEINNRLTAINLERDLTRFSDHSGPFPA